MFKSESLHLVISRALSRRQQLSDNSQVGYAATKMGVTNAIRTVIRRVPVRCMNFTENGSYTTILQDSKLVVLFLKFRKVIVTVSNVNPNRYSAENISNKKNTSAYMNAVTIRTLPPFSIFDHLPSNQCVIHLLDQFIIQFTIVTDANKKRCFIDGTFRCHLEYMIVRIKKQFERSVVTLIKVEHPVFVVAQESDWSVFLSIFAYFRFVGRAMERGRFIVHIRQYDSDFG